MVGVLISNWSMANPDNGTVVICSFNYLKEDREKKVIL